MGTGRKQMVGESNSRSGNCGFTSSFHVLHAHKLLSRTPEELREDDVVYSIMRRYLNSLPQETIRKIEDFTRTFGGGWANFTVNGFIYSNDASLSSQCTIDDLSIALPPEVVINFLEYSSQGKISGEVLQYANSIDPSASLPGEYIIGVGRKEHDVLKLKHYMYFKNGKFYSWGKKFASKAEFQAAQFFPNGNKYEGYTHFIKIKA